jgi:ABC-type branched-subunit amino acid transport system ATPase component
MTGEENGPAALRVQSVHAGYGKKTILHGISLEVQPGEIVALLGANGAGKSTLLKAAMGLIPLWEGSIWVGEREVTRLPVPHRARGGMSYLLQGGKAFPSLTTQQNLEIGASVLPPERRQAAIASALALFPGLCEDLDRRAGLLSGGQRQTLALGMVLAQSPHVLLLDEPTAGLAPNLAQKILESIREANRHLKMSVLLVEQRIKEALEVSDRVAMLVNGRLASENRTPSEWLKEDRLDHYLLFG